MTTSKKNPPIYIDYSYDLIIFGQSQCYLFYTSNETVIKYYVIIQLFLMVNYLIVKKNRKQKTEKAGEQLGPMVQKKKKNKRETCLE